ncbi:MAG: Rpn family recombination-promoting nuclease/putative transposase [Acidobacteriota bacterium]|nr:Rpn family recombination-promoting nuclease/putative transposase [Acidobacteriota bacterium]
MERLIDPRVDCIFKAILGTPGRESLTIHFLNHVLKLPEGKRIVTVEFLNPYNEKEYQGDKYSIIDIKVKDQAGNFYQIEIQIALHDDLIKRMLYTLAAMLKSQVKSGDDYYLLKPVTGIWLLGCNQFPEIDDPYLHFTLYERKHQRILSDDVNLHLMQLPKAPIGPNIIDEGDKWLHFFQHGRKFNLKNLPACVDIPEIREALKIMQGFTEYQRDYLLYESRLDAMRMENFWEKAFEREKAKVEKVTAEAEKVTAEAEEKVLAAEAKVRQEQKAREKAEADRERLIRELKKAGISLDSLNL